MEFVRSDEHPARRARLEARLDAEEREAAVAEQIAAGRGLVEAVAALCDRGTNVVVETADRRFVGRVTHGGEELFILDNGSCRVIVVAAAVTGVWADGSRAVPLPRTSGYPATAEALLRRLVSQGGSATLGRVSGSPVDGTIVAVARSHVEGRDRQGRSWLVPFGVLAWIELRRDVDSDRCSESVYSDS